MTFNTSLGTYVMTLIEMLVCLFLLSIMLCGLAIQQVYALRSVNRDVNLVMAIEQLNLIVAHIHLFAMDLPPSIMTQWQRQCRKRLIDGVCKLSGSYPHYRIQISWGPKSHPCTNTEGVHDTCLTYHMHV